MSANNTPTLILLTGRKKSGKDTFADLAKQILPDQVMSIAVADWFKELLTSAFHLDINLFYDEDLKERPFPNPLILSDVYCLALGDELEHVLDRLGIVHEGRSKIDSHLIPFMNLEIQTPRRLMEWFGFEFIRNCFKSDDIHCLITSKRLDFKLTNSSQPKKFVVITDARSFHESEYFTQKWPGASIRVKLLNPNIEQSQSGIEKATDDFPSGWFDHTLTNPFPNKAMYRTMVQKVLTS